MGLEAYIWNVRSLSRCAKLLVASETALIAELAPPYSAISTESG